MKKLTLKLIFLLISTLSTATSLSAQTDFEKYARQQREEFNAYKQQVENEFKKYRDSLNLAFATYLEKEWKSFDLQKPEPLFKKPVVTPPVYDNTAPQPSPEKIPVDVSPAKEPKPVPQPTTPTPQLPTSHPLPPKLPTSQLPSLKLLTPNLLPTHKEPPKPAFSEQTSVLSPQTSPPHDSQA